jgi:hypothetical protein
VQHRLQLASVLLVAVVIVDHQMPVSASVLLAVVIVIIIALNVVQELRVKTVNLLC